MLTITNDSRTSRGGLATLLNRAVAAVQRRRSDRRAARHLMQLDDHLLADVGLTRGDVTELYHG